MCNIKALFILHIEKMNFFKIRSKCITFVGIDNIMVGLVSVPASAFSLRYMCFIHVCTSIHKYVYKITQP